MKQTKLVLLSGLRVKTASVLGDTHGMLIEEKYLVARRSDVEGTIVGYVPGHGGDVYWVRHGNGDLAAYSFLEFEYANKWQLFRQWLHEIKYRWSLTDG